MDIAELESLIHTQAGQALSVPATPAYVYSEPVLRALAQQAALIAERAGCQLLYTLKACAIAPVLETLAPFVHGFAASSVFEARLADEVRRWGQSLHCYSPAYSAADMESTLSLADYLSLNSLNQLDLATSMNTGSASLGLRINPEMSFVPEPRYDPSRPGSKLGVPLSDLEKIARMPGGLQGAHIHNNCESDDLSQLAQSADALMDTLRRIDNLRWVNLGGGYYLGPETDAEPLVQVVGGLRSDFWVKVFIEPGTALAQQAGFLVSEALDVFPNDGTDIVVLDTSTSHLPEVFEYQYTPEVSRPESEGGQPTNLVGRSCLAGDVFGEYEFSNRVGVGERIAILNAGSYSHSRAVPSTEYRFPTSICSGRTGLSTWFQITPTTTSPAGTERRRLLLTERQASINPNPGDFAAIESEVAKSLGEDEIPARFAVTGSARGSYKCEIGVIAGERRHSVAPLFDFRRREYESQDAFNVVFMVPTGIGAEIGGHSGDATPAAILLAHIADTLITHPNVVNASDINELPSNGLYVEGSVLTRLMMGTVGLRPARSNRVLVALDGSYNERYAKYTVNAVNAARATYGLNCAGIVEIKPPMKVVGSYTDTGRASGYVEGVAGLLETLIEKRDSYDAVALASVVEVPGALPPRLFHQRRRDGQPLGRRRSAAHSRRLRHIERTYRPRAHDGVRRHSRRGPRRRGLSNGRRDNIHHLPPVRA